jgi:3-deoxy-manno-octulosonate cytidylyltransferase (CMP-KDO synthetase)
MTLSTANVLAVIPARLASQRLPAKPLKDIGGKSLLQRVWERGKQAESISRLIVATDSEEICSLARSFGAEVMMTAADITSGSQRVASVWKNLSSETFDYIVNLQGDMPFLRSELIDRCVRFFESHGRRFDMCTIATAIFDQDLHRSPHDVKVVVSATHEALYFSRAPIPHSRDGNLLRYVTPGGEALSVYGFKHFGLYVYRARALEEFMSGELSALEEVEKLEQLRLLERGLKVGVCVVDPALTAGSIEVDTAEDLERSRRLVADNK